MTGDSLTVRIEGDEPELRRLQRFALFLSDLRSFWPLVTRLFVGWEGRQFDTEGGFYGAHWEPLSPAYAAWKHARFPGKRILSREGPLRRAATTPKRDATPSTLTLTIDEYQNQGRTVDPAWFQEGTRRMPARPLIFDTLPVEAEAELGAAAERYVSDLLGRL